MNRLFKKQIISIIIISLLGIAACNEAGSAAAIKQPTTEVPIAGTEEQQALYRATFATEIGKDSIWARAFEKAFTSAFGADSLKQFLNQQTLPHIAINANQEIKGTERGEFVINAGATLTVNGILYGRVVIDKGGELINRGNIYGNIENSGGIFEDSGFHQGALITR